MPPSDAVAERYAKEGWKVRGAVRSGFTAIAGIAMAAVLVAVSGCGSFGNTGKNPAPASSATQPIHTSGTTASSDSASNAVSDTSAAPPSVVETQTAQLHPFTGGVPTSFTAVDFITAEDGWLGANDALGVTTNGGQTWTWHALPGLTVNSISFADPTSGWLVGSSSSCSGSSECQSVVMHSTDGGATWVRQEAAPCGSTCTPGTVHAIDATHAWAFVGCPRGPTFDPCVNLMYAGDRGQQWQPVGFPSGCAANSMAFVSATEGWVAGCRTPPQDIGDCETEILHTGNGGDSWQTEGIPSAIATGGAALSFINADDGWLAPGGPAPTMGGEWQPLYATTDGGQSWSLVKSSYTRMGFAGGPTFVTNAVGYIPVAAGAGVGQGAVVRTSDGGRTWSSSGDAEGWSMSSLSAVGTQDVWAIGQQKCCGPDFLVRSTDGGMTWTQMLPAPVPTAGVDFISAETGFGIGTLSDPGAVLKTEDGGMHWTVLAGPRRTPVDLTSIVFVNALDGWAAGTVAWSASGEPTNGGQPLLLATGDGGQTWSVVDRPAKAIVGFGFLNPRQGWMVTTGSTSLLWTTDDGGRSWTEGPEMPTGEAPASVAFLQEEGWSLRFAGHQPNQPYILSYSTNGGKAWSDLSAIPGSSGPFALDPVGSGDAWMAVTGALLYTTDGGRTWTEWNLGKLPGPESPEVLDFTGPQDGWLLTSQFGASALWRTVNGGGTWTQLW